MTLRPYQADLIDGVSKAWRQGFKAPCIVLGCGGGKSIITADMARKVTSKGKRVLFLVHRQELLQQIFGTFVRYGVDMRYCDVMMVQTATRRIKKLQRPALIITDENHHSVATSYKRIYDAFPGVPRVGVTATPVRLNGDGLGDVNDTLIVGPSTKWLIENNYLAPYDYYAPSVADLTGLHIKMGEFIASEIEGHMIKKAVFGDVIQYYRHYADGKKAICYCATLKHSIATAQAFSEAGISAVHIDGMTPPAQRRQIISDFRAGKIQILCNVDLISEGFDVPDCECAILLRPTQSLTLYIQQSMRCMRYRPDKRAIILDHVGNYARFGLPDEDRVWTLDKKERKRKRKQEDEEIAQRIKQCPECYYTFAAPPAGHRPICPACGYAFPVKERTQLAEEGAKTLEKIEGFKLDFTTADDCASYKDLLAYAKRRGYKPGWAYYEAKKRGYIYGGA